MVNSWRTLHWHRILVSPDSRCEGDHFVRSQTRIVDDAAPATAASTSSLVNASSGDVPLFVEHCEAVAAEVDVTRRWLGEQGRRGLSFSFDVFPERHGGLEVAYEPSVGESLWRLPA